MHQTKNGNLHMLLSLCSFFTLSIVLVAYILISGKDISSTANVLVSQGFGVGIPIILHFLITKVPVKETLIIRKTHPLNILLCILLAYAIIPTMTLISILSQFFVQNHISDAVNEISSLPLWAGLLVLALTPAILEEISMRSIIISNYRNKKVLTTCFVSGFFFAMFHMNINQALYAFVMGFVMCLAVHLTGSVLSSMIIHFTINGTSLFLSWIFKVLAEYAPNNPNFSQETMNATLTTQELFISFVVYLVINVFTIPIAGLIIYGLMKFNKKERMLADKLTTGQVLFGDPVTSTTATVIDNLSASSALNDYQNALNANDYYTSIINESNSAITQAPKKEKIWTASLIASVVIFSLWVITIDIVLPILNKILA